MRLSIPPALPVSVIRLLLSALVLAALSVALPGEAAQGCKLVKIGELPLRPFRGQLVTEGEVNGKKVGVLIDTGAYSTSIVGPAATKLGLQIDNAPRYEEYGVGGQTRVHSAVVAELRIGSAARRDFRIQVIGEHEFGADIAISLGADFFADTDAEFDVAGGAVRLFVAKDCEGASLAYWAPSGAGVVPIEDQGDIVLPIRINGSEMSAMLDSGAMGSVLSEPMADRLGVRRDSPGAAPSGCAVGYGQKAIEIWAAPFESFSIGDELIRNPRLRVADLWRNYSYRRAGSGMVKGRQSPSDMLLGADFLAAHRVLVSRSQKRMYFTYAGGIVFPVLPSLGCHEPAHAKDANGLIAEFDAALARNASDANALFERARVFARKRDYARALADCDATLRIEPRNTEALWLRSSVHSAMKDYDHAIADVDAALALGARHGGLYASRGDAWLAKGDADRALSDYSMAIELDPLGSGAYLARGRLWFARKEYDKAIADYDGAIRNAARKAPAYVERGIAWRAKGSFDEAIADFTRAIEADPHDARPFLLRSGGWRLKGQPDKALADCDAALAIDPKRAAALRGCGLARFDLGRHEGAERDFARLMELEPTGENAVWLFIAQRPGRQGRAGGVAQVRAGDEGDRLAGADRPVPPGAARPRATPGRGGESRPEGEPGAGMRGELPYRGGTPDRRRHRFGHVLPEEGRRRMPDVFCRTDLGARRTRPREVSAGEAANGPRMRHSPQSIPS